MKEKIAIFLVIGLIALIGNWIGYGVSPLEGLPGMIIVLLFTVIGYALAHYLPFKIPAVAWISLIAMLVTSPIFPGSSVLAGYTDKLNFMALATPILAYAGLSFGKDLQDFKKMSWRIVVVSLIVYTGTFLVATIFAEATFRLTGKFH